MLQAPSIAILIKLYMTDLTLDRGRRSCCCRL